MYVKDANQVIINSDPNHITCFQIKIF